MRLPRLVTLLAALFLTAAPLARAEDEAPTRLPLPDPLPLETDWFGLYVNGAKAGFAKQSSERRGEGADARVVLVQEAEIQVKAQGREVRYEISERSEFRALPPHELTKATFRTVTGSDEKLVEVERTAEGAQGRITQAGRTRTMPVPDLDYTLQDAFNECAWIRSAPEVGGRLTSRYFETSDLEMDAHTTTITARKESVVEGVKVAWYEVVTTSPRKGEIGTGRYDSEGRTLSFAMGGAMEMRREPEEVARKLDESVDLFVLGLAKLDRPIGTAEDVVELVLEADGEGAGRIPAAPRQSVARDEASGQVVVSLGAAHGGDHPATEAEIADSLRETVEHPTKHPDVVAMAGKAVGAATDPRERVKALVGFVSAYLEDAICPDPPSVLDLIERKKGDCSEHALLLTTLARAAGIPARQVSGLMYAGDEIQSFGGHAWNEVVLDGRWVPVDAAWDQMEIDATHVALARAEADSGRRAATLGRLSFRVRSVRTRGPAPEPGPEAPAAARVPRPFLYEARGPENAVAYLFGTIHVADERVLDLPAVVKQAIAASDVVLTELDMDSASLRAITARMFLPEGETLADVLPEELYDRLAEYLEGRGLGIAPFGRTKPWVLAATLPLLDSLDDYARREPLDVKLYGDAGKSGKEVGGIETPEEQLEIFDTLSREEQVQMLRASLDALEGAEAEDENPLKEMIDMYVAGDEAKVVAKVREMMAGEGELAQRLAKRLVDDRNVRMADRVEARLALAPSRTLFVAVGTAHVVGPNGVVELLKKKGWKVRRLEASEKIEVPEPAAPVR